jgi:collagen type V/XI/XXIV/XXVII alpha
MNSGALEGYPMEAPTGMPPNQNQGYSQGLDYPEEYNQQPGSEAYPGTYSPNPNQKPKKKGFFARLFGGSKKNSKTPGQTTDPEGVSQPHKRRGLFGRRRKKVNQQNGATQQPRNKRPGFFFRLFSGFRRKPKRNEEDIEMGNMNQTAEDMRVGRVKTGSPQLVQGEGGPRQSAVAVMGDNYSVLDASGTDSKRKDKMTTAKKKKHIFGVGLYAQTSYGKDNKRTTASRDRKKAEKEMKKKEKKAKKEEKKKRNKKGGASRRSGVYDESMMQGQPTIIPGSKSPSSSSSSRPAKRAAKVRYAPIAPSSHGLHQHVTGPKPKQRGAGRTAVAAVNPGNWFWMDVYWK